MRFASRDSFQAFIRRSASAATVVTASILVFAAIGCGLGVGNGVTGSAAGSGPGSGSSQKQPGLRGMAHGGNLPITGAVVQLWAAGTTGAAATGASGTTPGTPGVYGTGASALIVSGPMTLASTTNFYPGGLPGCTYTSGNPLGCTALPMTDSSGNFNITGDYTCPAATTPDTQVYITVVGGNPGLTSGTNNTASTLIAGLGSCTALAAGTSYTFINVNEVSTVATVWALQQFMSTTMGTANTTVIGAPSSNINGLANAFSMIPNLANLPAGTAVALNAYATPETAKINALADIIAACVNTTGPSAGTCAQLISAATVGTAPADTVQIALNMAQNPISLVGDGSTTGTYQYLASIGTPFSPTPSAVPTDYTIGVQIAPQTSTPSNAIGAGYGIAADKFGNIWLSQSGNGTTPSASVVELSPAGALLVGPVTSYTPSATTALAVDMTAAPTPVSTAFTSPKGVVIDSSNNAWVANGATVTVSTTTNSSASANSGGDFTSALTITKIGSVAELTGSAAAGAAASGSITGYYTGPSPSPAAADGSGNVFFTSADTTSGNQVSKVVMGINNSTFAYTQSASAAGAVATTGTSPASLVVDQNKTFSGGPILYAIGSGSCSPYGTIIEMQTKATLPVYVNTGTLSPLSYGSSGGTAPSINTTNNNLVCGTTIRQRFTAPVQTMYGMAVDSSSNLWITNSATANYVYTTYTDTTYNALTYLQQTLTSATFNTSTNGSLTTNFANLSAPKYIAIDGNNHAWVVSANTLTTASSGTCSSTTPCNSIAEFAQPSPLPLTSGSTFTNLSGTYGFVHTFASPGNLTIDLSGNVWVANTSSSANYVTVIVGAAGPVLPGAYAIASSMIGLKP
jgi:hypothetical protein